MLTLLISLLIIAAIIGTIGVVGIGGATMEVGKMLFFCAIVLVLVSAVVGIMRGKARA